MQRFLVILFASSLGLAFYYWSSRVVKKKSVQDFILTHQWLLHPNAICYWRAGMALVAFVFYFIFHFQIAAILIFTLAAVLDGVDGLVGSRNNR